MKSKFLLSFVVNILLLYFPIYESFAQKNDHKKNKLHTFSLFLLHAGPIKTEEGTGNTGFTREIRYGYKDSSGKIVIDPIFKDANEFIDGLAAVHFNNKWGYIEEDFGQTGKYFIDPQFNYSGSFSEGVAVVKIYPNGNPLDQPEEENPDITSVFKRYRESLTEGRYGYITKDFSKTGNFYIEPVFNNASLFLNGLAAVQYGRLWGYITKEYAITDEFFINPRFFAAMPFCEGMAAVAEMDGWGYIDKNFSQTGEFAIEPQFEFAECFENGRALVRRLGETFHINKNGDRIPKY